jgi:UDP-N-acetylglucosamine 2-epimerase (non-hydrolysing)
MEGLDIVVGTRPDIIKMFPLIFEMDKRKLPFKINYTSQHTMYEMFGSFVDLFGLKEIIEKNLIQEPFYKTVCVYGDTDSCFKKAYEYKRTGRNVLHIEAGLRCEDNFMLEEINRRLVDRITDYFFCPTNTELENIKTEGLIESKLSKNNMAWITGNLISDSIEKILQKNRFRKKEDVDILITIHRRENIYNKDFLILLEQIQKLQKTFKIVFPIHPHTLNKLTFGWEKKINFISPLSYLDFINFLKDCKLVVTDSGGVLEESCILHKPCVVVRKFTERPHAMERNGILCPNYEDLFKLCNISLTDKKTLTYSNPYSCPDKNLSVSEFMCDIIDDFII